MQNPVKLISSHKSFEIEVLKARLQEQGIESYIMNKQDSAYVVIGEVELYVNEADLEKARAILNQDS